MRNRSNRAFTTARSIRRASCVLTAVAGSVLSVSVASAAEINSIICSERASAERLLGIIMELPSLEADADISRFEEAFAEEVTAGKCTQETFTATDQQLVRHPDGAAHFGIVELGEHRYAIEFDIDVLGIM